MNKNITLYQEPIEDNEYFCNIAMIGAGYVGLVTGTCLASLGHTVYCFDLDVDKIKKLQQGEIYIHEPNLSELIIEQIKLNRLIFTNDLQVAVEHAEAIFIAVGTPQESSGKANLSFVETAMVQIAALLRINDYKLIVIKSTVPVGTCRQMYAKILQVNPLACIEIASNPEFLREGSGVFDFMNPERIVIGINKNKQNQDPLKAQIILRKIYKKFIDNHVSVLFNDLESSELIKYASNCFLSVKIAFINELADLCEGLNKDLNNNVDILTVTNAMGLDSRIGEKFLQPGPGFGGSCFPKDTLALSYCAEQHNISLSILNAAITANKKRIKNLSTKIINICKNTKIGAVTNKTIAILGIAFKANTDDIRDSVAITVINDLYANGAILQIYDPKALEQGKNFFKSLNNVLWADNVYAAIANADVIVILTEWLEFVNLDLARVKGLMKNQHYVIIDFRNIFRLDKMQNAGFSYYATGRGNW
jgi:UDPglucose 6-dehydrogenase